MQRDETSWGEIQFVKSKGHASEKGGFGLVKYCPFLSLFWEGGDGRLGLDRCGSGTAVPGGVPRGGKVGQAGTPPDKVRFGEGAFA